MTQDQWLRLHDELTLPKVQSHCQLANCDVAAELGQALFFEPALSGTGTYACTNCHDPNHWFIDTRVPNNVSQSLGANGFTKRNSPSLVDLAYKPQTPVFTWSGKYSSAGAVLDVAIHKVMASDSTRVGEAVRDKPLYNALYTQLFGPPPVPAPVPGSVDADPIVFANLELVFDAYLERLVSIDSPFDRWRDGDLTALSDEEQRGFAVFVGKGGCIDCHREAMFSDFEYRNTGVTSIAPNTGQDQGRFEVTQDPADLGMFVTPMLRNVAQTGPYMHDGSLATLRDVVEFYRRGGDPGGLGTRDPRIVPLDLTDGDASDLVAFLGALTGDAVDPALTRDNRTSARCVP